MRVLLVADIAVRALLAASKDTLHHDPQIEGILTGNIQDA